MARLKSIQASESQEQRLLVEWAWSQERRIPELAMLYAIPNQGAARLKKLQMEGTKRGVPDLCLAVARGQYHGLYIEMKRIKGGKLSMEQISWLSRLTAEGYCAEVAYGFEDAQAKILRYLRGEDGNGGSGE